MIKQKTVRSWYTNNDGTRSVTASAVVPEVRQALEDWKKVAKTTGILIGGMALSYWTKPRTTMDIDMLFSSASEIPKQVEGFKRTRTHGFKHKRTHVEVEALDPDFLKIPHQVVNKIVDTAHNHDGILVASKEGLIVSKLFRFSLQDQADIAAILDIDKKALDISGFHVGTDLEAKYLDLVKRVGL